MLVSIAMVALCLALLSVGAELLIRGSRSVGLRAGLSPATIGLTLVACATSLPELSVSMQSALAGDSTIALANIVGSNIFNIAVILGLTALVCPLPVQGRVARVDTPILVAVSLAFWLAMWDGAFGLTDACLALIALVAYFVWTLRATVPAPLTAAEGTLDDLSRPVWLDSILIVSGVALLVFASPPMTTHAKVLAVAWGVSDAIIGLTVVAIGTSAPEFVTSIVAALRGQPDMAVGNVIGSNIFNILAIGGTVGLFSPLPVSAVSALDLACLVLLPVLVAPLLWTGFRVSRWEGAVLLAAYIVYGIFRL